jgi:hypothetical protein
MASLKAVDDTKSEARPKHLHAPLLIRAFLKAL